MEVGKLFDILGKVKPTDEVTFVQLGLLQSGSELTCTPQAGRGFGLESLNGNLIINHDVETDYTGTNILAEKLKEILGKKIQSGECKPSYKVYVKVPLQESATDYPRRIYDTEDITANSGKLFLFFGDYSTMKK